MRTYHCSVCGKRVEDDLLVYIKHTEEHIIEEIKKKNPHWVEDKGVCHKCEEHYHKQMKG